MENFSYRTPTRPWTANPAARRRAGALLHIAKIEHEELYDLVHDISETTMFRRERTTEDGNQ